MQTKTIKIIDNTIINQLEKLQYELEAYKNLIAWYINNNLNLTNNSYLQLKQEYIDTFTQYNKIKQKFETQYIKTELPQAKSWNLNFNTHEVIIYYED